jgi:hypothetical protein
MERSSTWLPRHGKLDKVVKSLCLTQSHEATKEKYKKIQKLLFVIFACARRLGVRQRECRAWLRVKI